MKANELMIGDWVYQAQFSDLADPNIGHGWKPVKVTSVPFDKDCFIEPIPLTSEILEKNGFVGGEIRVFTTPFLRQRVWCKVEVYEYQPIRGGKQLNAFRLMIGGKEHSGVDIHINSVHELQHALRLCGIDKNIEL